MHKYNLSILLGLASAVAVIAPKSVEAATFNFDNLQYISSRPIDSANRLDLLGTPSENQGYSAFFNLDSSAPDYFLEDISLNASGNGAPYYTTGRQGSPQEPPTGATRTANVSGIAGFSTLSSYLTNNAISFSNLGFGFGQKSDRPFTTTWNLGENKRFVSDTSTIEERIYTANPDDVELFLSYGTTKIVSFGYSDVYSVLDYGATTQLADDIDVGYTDPTQATKITGLAPFEEALANAFLEDIATAGGGVQVFIEDNQVDDSNFKTGNGFGVINLRFVGSLRAVTIAAIPEPSHTLGLLMFGTLVAIFRWKKQKYRVGHQLRRI
ncbi:hypothetical protein [Nostoc commune]|uniref:hypothetical protein n=1 Tax=Nostoc commune TaxID=1178 RepID=UPI0018C4804F|nr:hypothetical protein [Nostoc commune]MBG1264667.1 hypothetical protein [Nostoc commune BAE]